jgi:drug/metabolite transporter (DMT)-like permease
MKKLLIFMVLAVFLLSSCASITAPVSISSHDIGSKTGVSTGKIYLGLFGTADAGIVKAAENGGITKISTVDFTYENLLFIVTTFTCTVTGE